MCFKRKGLDLFSRQVTLHHEFHLSYRKIFQQPFECFEILDNKLLHFMCDVWWKFIRDNQSSQGSSNRWPYQSNRGAVPRQFCGQLFDDPCQLTLRYLKILCDFLLLQKSLIFLSMLVLSGRFLRPRQFSFWMVKYNAINIRFRGLIAQGSQDGWKNHS